MRAIAVGLFITVGVLCCGCTQREIEGDVALLSGPNTVVIDRDDMDPNLPNSVVIGPLKAQLERRGWSVVAPSEATSSGALSVGDVRLRERMSLVQVPSQNYVNAMGQQVTTDSGTRTVVSRELTLTLRDTDGGEVVFRASREYQSKAFALGSDYESWRPGQSYEDWFSDQGKWIAKKFPDLRRR